MYYLRVNAYLPPAYISTSFDVDSSSYFPFKAQTDRHTDIHTDAQVIVQPTPRPPPEWVTRPTRYYENTCAFNDWHNHPDIYLSRSFFTFVYNGHSYTAVTIGELLNRISAVEKLSLTGRFLHSFIHRSINEWQRRLECVVQQNDKRAFHFYNVCSWSQETL